MIGKLVLTSETLFKCQGSYQLLSQIVAQSKNPATATNSAGASSTRNKKVRSNILPQALRPTKSDSQI